MQRKTEILCLRKHESERVSFTIALVINFIYTYYTINKTVICIHAFWFYLLVNSGEESNIKKNNLNKLG